MRYHHIRETKMKRMSETERVLECLVCPMIEECERKRWAEQGKEDMVGSCQFFKAAGYKVIWTDAGCSCGFIHRNRRDKEQ